MNLKPSVFNSWFSFSLDQYNYKPCSRQGTLINSSYKTNRYGKYSVIASAVDSSNKIQNQLKNTLLRNLSPNNTETVVSNFYLTSY